MTGEAKATAVEVVVSLVVVVVAVVENKVPWGKRFLNDEGELNWDKIIVSGHSQGASHAAYL